LPARNGRRGFSFIEVLFAVMILGIGFIMIAGIFPVAISQTASSQEETIGAASVNGAVAALAKMPYPSSLTANDQVIRLTDDATSSATAPTWKQLKGNQILQDPRYAWVPLLKRDKLD